jgi:hypothetical protein
MVKFIVVVKLMSGQQMDKRPPLSKQVGILLIFVHPGLQPFYDMNRQTGAP